MVKNPLSLGRGQGFFGGHGGGGVAAAKRQGRLFVSVGARPSRAKLGEAAAGESAGVERFTAGSLTIQEGGGADAAERSAALRLQAETVLGPYLADRGFAFQGVEG